MLIVRTLNAQKYSKQKKRFGSDSFQKHGNGISVFGAECAKSVSACICAHINIFYKSTVKTPILFWLIDTEELKQFEGYENITLEQCDSESGDSCHHDILNIPLGDSKVRNLIKNYCIPPNIYRCDNTEEVVLSAEEFENLDTYIVDPQ